MMIVNVTCPVLIIHGNNGERELQLYENSIRAMNFLSKDSKLEIIEGANHSFLEQYDVVIQLANNWFLKHFK